MSKKENKKLYGRAELKKYFKNGQVPSEIHYEYLIDSLLNQQDDGFSKDSENAFIISPVENKKLVTFYNSIDKREPFFYIKKDDKVAPSLKFQPGGGDADAGDLDESSFFFHQDGSLGLGKRIDNSYKLDVKGFMGSEGRVGTYMPAPGNGVVKADGKWHVILEDLDNCQAFEVVARTGKIKTGKFAILHAIALSTFGRSRSKIKKTSAYYGFFWNKLNLRWKSTDTRHYNLELRSNRNYGEGVDIYYHITKLWDDELMLPKDSQYYYQEPAPKKLKK